MNILTRPEICYNDNKEHQKASQYAENQLAQFEKDILEHSWNKFFRTYLESLLNLGDYKQAKTIRRNELLEKENVELKIYLGPPYFKWFMTYIDFKEGNIGDVYFKKLILHERDCLAISYNSVPSESVMC